jgi:hypothetical protein
MAQPDPNKDGDYAQDWRKGNTRPARQPSFRMNTTGGGSLLRSSGDGLVIEPSPSILQKRGGLGLGTVVSIGDRDDVNRFGQAVTPARMCHHIAVAGLPEGPSHHGDLLG